MNNTITTSHPKNNSDVTVTFDENHAVIGAVYADNGEEVDITPSIKSHLQADVDKFVPKGDEQ